MVSRTLFAALAGAAFLATISPSAANCASSCLSTQTSCSSNCGASEDCIVKCTRTAIKCTCECRTATTRSLPASSLAAERGADILRLAGTVKSTLGDLTKCITDASANDLSCVSHCNLEASCLQKCQEKTLDEMCACGAASLRAGILVTLVALLSWFARH